MVKHIQTIRRQEATNYLSVFDHFVGLALKGLNKNNQTKKIFASCIFCREIGNFKIQSNIKSFIVLVFLSLFIIIFIICFLFSFCKLQYFF